MNPRTLFFILALAVFLGIGFMSASQMKQTPTQNVLHLPSGDIALTISDTKASREQGLSGTKPLSEKSAMLFVFDTPDSYGFWMKDMKYSIDMIWLDENRKVVTVESAVSPETFPKVFYPADKSLYVLEANAGFVSKNSIKVGDTLEFDLLK